MSVRESLIAELELAVKDGSPEHRAETLRRVTDLFLNDADRLSDEQIEVFDDVLCLLVRRIETRALAELSKRLAPVDNAPVELIKHLAREDEILVARPVLTQSKRLTASDLVEIVQTKSQAHLLAISERDQLENSVTEVLLNRGNREVIVKLAANAGARFSDTGYSTLVGKAEADSQLAESVGLRLDIPLRLLHELLKRATDAVRSKILSLAPPQMQNEIRRVIADIADAVSGAAANEHDFTDAVRLVQSMHNGGTLDERALLDFANQRRFEEMTVALAQFCSAPLKTVSALMIGLRNDAVLIPCKAADLTWPTVEAILRNRHSNHNVSDQIIELARNDYVRLSVATAQRSLRFLQVREAAR
jgi:uncharacterized protein (DUF2336 family)